ncbi:MAG: hypothetical protein F6K54_03125 [Okeania sp. SIO3B5]|uniref:hypothetical protein n=1 Tax=Okeania sp. SIO3B5 TaxID=2607811 RepID=UPI0013FE90FF|nr:hypothetical protein [Okeania sp. SIO3B5]NEO52163.1 hypothetical protein [Okeania sp. SIO3B5]
MKINFLVRRFRVLLITVVSFALVLSLAQLSNAAFPDVDIDFLYKPKPMPVAIVPDIRDIEQAYQAISDIPGSRQMRVPIPSENPRERIFAEGTVNRRTNRANPITVENSRDMFRREVALRMRRGTQRSLNTLDQSTLVASMDLSNIAQYERCVYVDSYGKVHDKCVVDLVIRDAVSNQRWILPNVLIDKFCVYVMKASIKKTWF